MSLWYSCSIPSWWRCLFVMLYPSVTFVTVLVTVHKWPLLDSHLLLKGVPTENQLGSYSDFWEFVGEHALFQRLTARYPWRRRRWGHIGQVHIFQKPRFREGTRTGVLKAYLKIQLLKVKDLRAIPDFGFGFGWFGRHTANSPCII